jgi:hypothetical protein
MQHQQVRSQGVIGGLFDAGVEVGVRERHPPRGILP